jgi:hypothetical protein
MLSESESAKSVDDVHLGPWRGTGKHDNDSVDNQFWIAREEAKEYRIGGIFPFAQKWQNWITWKNLSINLGEAPFN